LKYLLIFIFFSASLFASFSASIIDSKTLKPLLNVSVCDSDIEVRTDENGSFNIDTNQSTLHIKAYGYRPYKIDTNTTNKEIKLQAIKVKALYLSFWHTSNNSKRLKEVLDIIDSTELNAIVIDIKNEYGSTSFLTSFEQANSYGAHKSRTNRDIQKFIKLMKEKNIYTIARIVTFKDEIQASHNEDYAIKKDDGTIWRNHDKMAWVDPFDKRSHEYTIRIAQEAAKVGFDEINFDYIRFPAKDGLALKQESTEESRVKTIGSFLDLARKKLRKYGVFISVDTYGNVCWSKDDNGIGQTIESLAKHADYLCPMLYPSGFAPGSFYFKYPADHPYEVIYRSIKNIKDRIDTKRVRPWLQYFKDYGPKKRYYKKFEVTEQIRATENINANGWMLWSPSSRYNKNYFKTK
jgi:hypothetical protein